MNAETISAARRNAAAYWSKLPDNVRGAAWILASGVLFTMMATLVKELGERYDIFQIGLFRSLIGFLVLMPLILPHGLQAFRTRRPVLHLSRAVCGVVAMAGGFYGLANLPIADVTAIGFGLPLFLIVTAVLFLGEKVRWRRWTATVVGFVGVVIMLRPGQGPLEIATLVVIGSTMLVSFAATMVKILTRTESTLTSLAWFGIVSSVAMALPATLNWKTPEGGDWVLLILVGVLGAVGQTCTVRAYTVGEATAIAPFDYFKMIYAILVGIVIFGEWPDEWTLVGAAVIICSTLYIARREARLSESQRVALPKDRDGVSPPPPS